MLRSPNCIAQKGLHITGDQTEKQHEDKNGDS